MQTVLSTIKPGFNDPLFAFALSIPPLVMSQQLHILAAQYHDNIYTIPECDSFIVHMGIMITQHEETKKKLAQETTALLQQPWNQVLSLKYITIMTIRDFHP
jgi:hypothetical protein